MGQPVDVLAGLDVERFNPCARSGLVDAWVERAEQASPELQSLRAQLDAAHGGGQGTSGTQADPGRRGTVVAQQQRQCDQRQLAL